MTPLEPDKIAWAIHIACLLEVCADKPGNVTWGKDFLDTRFVDFMASAVAVGPALGDASQASIDSIILLCGFAALRLFPNLEDPDMALILLGTALPVVGRVIFFLGLLAAIMSTVNSFLQSGASSLAYDAFRHLRPQAGPRRLLSLSRLFVVLLGLLSLALALRFQMIVPALMFTLSMWTAGMLIPALAALMGNKLREKTALHSLLGGALASLVWRVWQPCDVDALFVGLGFSLLVAVASERLSGHSRLRE